jgi:hypothetical protein
MLSRTSTRLPGSFSVGSLFSSVFVSSLFERAFSSNDSTLPPQFGQKEKSSPTIEPHLVHLRFVDISSSFISI